MGSIGTVNTQAMSISDFKIEEKKWNQRERQNLENALAFMSKEFGNIKDLIGNIYRRTSSAISASGKYDREGYMGRGRATYFATDNYAREETIIHEFTHSITDEIASHYKQLGYKNEQEVFSAMRSQVYNTLSKEEPKWDGRKWAHRPEEYLSRNLEVFTVADRDHAGPEAKETLKVVKEWFRKVRR